MNDYEQGRIEEGGDNMELLLHLVEYNNIGGGSGWVIAKEESNRVLSVV